MFQLIFKQKVIVLILVYIVSVKSLFEEYGLIKSSKKFLHQVYSDADFCLLIGEAKCKESVHPTCSVLHKQSSNHNIPKIMYYVPSQYSTQPDVTKLTNLFIHLNNSNTALVLLGDSLMRNTLASLYCILLTENRDKIVKVSPPLEKIQWGASHNVLTLETLKGNIIFTLDVYYFAVWSNFDDHTIKWFNTSMIEIAQKNPLKRFFITANIGLHEHNELSMFKHLSSILMWAKNFVTSSNNTHKFIYRETSSQHYESPTGYFDFHQRNLWRNGTIPYPTCAPNQEVGTTNDWRVTAERRALDLFHIDAKHIVPFRNMSAPYFEMHAASSYFSVLYDKKVEHSRRNLEDCTHFKQGEVLLRYLWYELLTRWLS